MGESNIIDALSGHSKEIGWESVNYSDKRGMGGQKMKKSD